MNRITLSYNADEDDIAYGNSALRHFEMHLEDGYAPDVIECMFMFMEVAGYTPENIFTTMKEIVDEYDASNFMDYFCDRRG